MKLGIHFGDFTLPGAPESLGQILSATAKAEVEKTILVLGINPVDDVDGFLAAMEPYARMGVELVEIPPQGKDPAGMVARLGEKVVPRLAELGVA